MHELWFVYFNCRLHATLDFTRKNRCFLCILFNSGCFLNTFYTALDGTDFLNFGLKAFWGSKLLSEWKFDGIILFFRKPQLVLTCLYPQRFIGYMCMYFVQGEDFTSEYHLYELRFVKYGRELLIKNLDIQRQNI